VPSPTFTLVQTYPEARIEVRHFDLYRLAGSADISELGLGETAGTLTLAEWPERAGAAFPVGALMIALAMAGKGRSVRLSGPAAWAERLAAILPAVTLRR
jgi:tRNA threonylcarbamoyl adenosine modification protein YjeE